MDLRHIPPNTCPLCRRQALALQGGECHCAACKSVFLYDSAHKVCRYTAVAPRFAGRFAEIEPILIAEWLTRQQVFDLAEPFALPPPKRHPTTPPAPLPPSRVSLGLWVVALSLLGLACVAAGVMWAMPQLRLVWQASTPTATVALAPAIIFSPNLIPSPSPAPTVAPTNTPADVTALLPTAVLPIGTLKPLPTLAPPRTATPTGLIGALVSPPSGPTPTLPPTFTPRPLVLVGVATSPAALATSPATAVINALNSPIQLTATVPPPPSIEISSLNFQGDSSLKEADEFVELHNLGEQGLSLRNWTIGLKGGEKLSLSVLGSGFILSPKQKCRIYTNSPPLSGGCGPLSFNRNSELWPNSGGVIELYDQNEKLIAQYNYPK
ncbi:MAG: lamin tail domain-containing protein [Anaerolineae bacterium]|nr:lamin tail domain-containing protein [Anaerolineae bacterium]